MSKVPKAIEFKAGTLTAMTAIVRDLDSARLGEVLHALLGEMDDYFAGELAVIDVGQLEEIPQQVDWAALATLLGGYGLQTVAIRNAPDELLAGARAAGMAVLARSPGRAAPQPAAPVEDIAPVEATPSTNTTATVTTKVIDRPVRSGQQVYAPGGDLILLNGVNPGAEVIADGNIHCYGPLRGRAVAGAQGNTAARIFCSNFGPELISIAGVYRTFERGIEANLANKPTQARLRLENTAQRDSAAAAGADAEAIVKHMLIIEPIQLD